MPVPNELCPKRFAVRLSIAALLLAALLVPADKAISQQPYYYQPSPNYYHNDTVEGTVTGGALGAITGAIVGGRHNQGEGALIGAGVGALTGNLLGRSRDRADAQQAAAGASVVAQANQRAAAQAVTNYDLVNMSQAGVNDDLVISTMQSRGTRLNLSPQELIALKQNGVSDRVLLAAQNMSGGSGYLPVPVASVPASPTVIVSPAPYPYYRHCGYHGYHGYYGYHGYHGSHYPRHHSRVYIGGRW